jgi:flagella basal body P-ring formation protein FlgA
MEVGQAHERQGPQRFDSSAIIAVAERALRASLLSEQQSVVVRPVGEVRAHVCQNGGTVDPVITADPVRPRARMRSLVTLQCAGAAPKQIPVWFAASVLSFVPVAVKQLHAGSMVRAGDLRWETRDVASLRGIPARVNGDEHAWRTRSIVASGDVVLESDLVPEPDVVGHQALRVAYVSGALRLEFTGEALQDGREGDRIRVRNPSSGGELIARVTGERQAEVSE